MKKTIFLLLFVFILIGCNQKEKQTNQTKAAESKLKIERFDQLFFETKPENLKQLQKQFPYFFPSGNDDAVWISKMQNPQWRELYAEVQKKFGDFNTQSQELEMVFENIKTHFPKTKAPKVITIISEMDYTNKVIYADSLLVISLELYLGKSHKFYQFPDYLKQNFESKQMMPDVVASFTNAKMPPLTDKTLLSLMIDAGKILYAKDVLLPEEYTDADKIGYTEAQIVWCQENESYMWRYFLEKELLYSSEGKLANRFINPAPFSKFYLEIDNQSPGQVGAWLGWQIVKSYAKNNEVSLEKILQMNAKQLFEKSKYKPKK